MCSYPAASIPELSIVVPILNECQNLSSLLATLERQQGVVFEVILCDGGSTDGSLQVLKDLVDTLPFVCRLLVSSPGRAKQLNIGAAHSRAGMLLFLHADSSFDNQYALARGVAFLKSAHQQSGHQKIAGHFPLCFIRRSVNRSWAFYYYAWKARMQRPYCTHGDQGFLLSGDLFRNVGPFDESLPFLEDVRLAKNIENYGQWLLLPEVIGTSARRFEDEGFYRRQVLNALVLACEEAGCGAWLDSLPGLYRQQSACNRLSLVPFFSEIARKIALLDWKARLRFWRKIGTFVCDNAWQLALMVDTWRHYRKGSPVGEGRLAITECFEKFATPIIRWPLGSWLAALLAWIWYRWWLFVSIWS